MVDIMCNREIILIINEIKKNNNANLHRLLSVFEGLIYSYGKKLNYDDAGQELTVFLIELFNKINTDNFPSDASDGLKRYIAVAIRNKYISLSKSNQEIKNHNCELKDNVLFDFQNNDDAIMLKEGMKLLSEKQKLTLVLRYVYGYSDAEIGDKLSISRQAVHKLENRGLNILREYFVLNKKESPTE